MLFRAYSISGDLVEFTLRDGPVLISKDALALFAREGAELLYANTLMLGDEKLGVYEGDGVYYKNAYIGTVVYDRGFFLQKIDGTLKKLEITKHIKVKKGKRGSCSRVLSPERFCQLVFKYGETPFQIQSIISIIEGKLAVRKVAGLLDTDKIKVFTGYRIEDTSYFYGDVLEDGTKVVSQKGLPALLLTSGAYMYLSTLETKSNQTSKSQEETSNEI